MAIRWSAVKVSEAIDKVEQQITLAEPFLDEAKRLANEALSIPNLPEYMSQRFRSLIAHIERLSDVKGRITSARSTIPEGAIEEELQNTRHCKTESLI